jgi:hypothetical protein
MVSISGCKTGARIIHPSLHIRRQDVLRYHFSRFVILRYDKNIFMEYATYIRENPAKLHRKKSAKSVPGKNPRKGKSSI